MTYRSSTLLKYNDRARRDVDNALVARERSWYWLSNEAERAGVASASTVLQWRSRVTESISCGLYLSLLHLVEPRTESTRLSPRSRRANP